MKKVKIFFLLLLMATMLLMSQTLTINKSDNITTIGNKTNYNVSYLKTGHLNDSTNLIYITPIRGKIWDDTLRFDHIYTTYHSDTIKSSIPIIIKSTGKYDGSTESVLWFGDGTNSPEFSNCVKVAGSPTYNTILGFKNLIIFTAIYDYENDNWIIYYNIIQQ